MSRTPKLRFRVVAVLFFLLRLSVAAEAPVASHESLQLKEIVSYVAVPDVKRTLNTLERIASAHLPAEQYKPGTIAAILDDPLLKNLTERPIVFAAFKAEGEKITA